METKKAPLSIRVIYWITNISFWIALGLSLILLVSNILLFTGAISSNNLYSRNLQVNVKVTDTPHTHTGNLNLNLKVADTANYLNFINPNNFFAKKVAPFLFLYFLIFTYLIWVFRIFITNVKRGETFTVKNIFLLKRISYALAAFWLVVFSSEQLANYYLSGQLEIYKSFLSNEYLLWDALFIWVLAHIFITGLKLQQEKELTI